jgi:hypothetical protein
MELIIVLAIFGAVIYGLIWISDFAKDRRDGE